MISRVKDIYENAMKDPQSLTKVIREEQAGEIEFEELFAVCEDAYTMKTGKDDFYDHFEQTAYPEIELNWNEEEGLLEEIFPKLTQKFW